MPNKPTNITPTFAPRVLRWSERSAEVAWKNDGTRLDGANDMEDNMVSLYHDGDLCVTVGDVVLHVSNERGVWSVTHDGRELVRRVR